MKIKLLGAAFAAVILNLAVCSVTALAVDPTNASPLVRAESLGSYSYDALVAGLQDKIDGSNASDQDWITKVWAWSSYVLHDILHDPDLVEYVKIDYMTTTAAGDLIPVTGLAILPTPHAGASVPILAMQHPTQVERKYSPSMFNKTNMWDDKQFTVPFGTLFAMSGFAVVMADYPGMGVNTNVHPYCTESLANCVVDLVRAVRDYLATNTSAYARWDGRLYLTGYSEGGYATLLAARDFQAGYSNEFPVSGVAGLDGPYSLSDTMRDVMLNADTNFVSPYFLPYFLNGYDSVYAALDTVFVFTNAVKTSAPGEPDLAGKLQWMCTAGTNTAGDINDLMYKAVPYIGPRSILTGAYLGALSNSESVLCRVLGSNDAYFAWTPQMQMRLFHYPNDDLVPYGNSTNACNVFTQRLAPHVDLDAYGAEWPLSWFIEWLKVRMDSSYHAAAAPVAWVKGILWLHSLAYANVVNSRLPNDADGDSLSDLVLYDEASGTWQALQSNRVRSWRKSNPDPAPMRAVQFLLGGPGWTPVLKDFDGDGKADPGVYSASSGLWTVRLSWFDYLSVSFPLGDSDSVPAPQDYDGDAKSDPAVYNLQSGLWTIYRLSTFQIVNVRFGEPGDLPVNGDFDGDGKADPAVYRESSGEWRAALSGDNYALAAGVCGGPGYTPVPGDYDGDGKTDPAVYRESSGDWSVLLSGSRYSQYGFNFGGPGFIPVAGDYDGDAKADIVVYNEASGFWKGLLSGSSYGLSSGYFGGAGYLPVP